MPLTFPRKTSKIDSRRLCVGFSAVDVETTVGCFISMEALSDHFGLMGMDARLACETFENNRAFIEDETSKKYELLCNSQTPFTEVLMKSEDF